MSFDKMNENVKPSDELLNENQVWKFGKTGWRRCKTDQAKLNNTRSTAVYKTTKDAVKDTQTDI